MSRGFNSTREQGRDIEKCVDSDLWHACAGNNVQIPPVNSTAFYFPQGHAEHAQTKVDFENFRIPSQIICKVSSIKYMAEHETDEVFAKIKLIPVTTTREMLDDEVIRTVPEEKSTYYTKTLTQSDANNGGGFSVPRACADLIFPHLNFDIEPPAQNIIARDVHGELWQFRHIYRGTPRRHLLTTGWSNFVNEKKLVAGDSIVFLKRENGDISLGIRRAKSRYEPLSGYTYGTFSGSVKGNDGELAMGYANSDTRGKLTSASVVEAAKLAASGQPFEFYYYPSSSSPEFFVSASAVRAAMSIRWCPTIRIKMAVEREDSPSIKCFMGIISSVEVADPIRWPYSPWRILKVDWDDAGSLQNMQRVNPWSVEVVQDLPTIDNLSPFSPSRKKLRLPPPDIRLLGDVPFPSFKGNPFPLSNPLCSLSLNIPSGIQGVRHTQYGLSSSGNHQYSLGLSSIGFRQLSHPAAPLRIQGEDSSVNSENDVNVARIQVNANPPQTLKAKAQTKTSQILLFGKLISTEQQSPSESGITEENSEKVSSVSDGIVSALNKNGKRDNSSDKESLQNNVSRMTDYGPRSYHCKVFMDSRDLGFSLDLSVLSSYGDLYEKLAGMFRTERYELLGKVLYCDTEGVIRQTGDESFTDFLKTACVINVLIKAGHQ